MLTLAGLGMEPEAAHRGCLDKAGATEAAMADQWIHADRPVEMMRDSGEDDAAYAVGWTISGVATLATIVAVWVFAI